MTDKFTERERRLYRQTDETLHYLWDPIGVRGVAQARDEYHAYLPGVFSMVLRKGAAQEIVEYLVQIEEEHMGLNPDRSKALEVARVLLDIREAIIEDGY